MNISDLVAFARLHSGAPEPEIRAAVAANWPHHVNYTLTQARLLASLLSRKRDTDAPSQRKR